MCTPSAFTIVDKESFGHSATNHDQLIKFKEHIALTMCNPCAILLQPPTQNAQACRTTMAKMAISPALTEGFM
jgi:hypothetical protein